MSGKAPTILPLATALASLASMPATVDHAAAKTPDTSNLQTGQSSATAQKGEPNVLFKAGEDLLGLIVTEQADGTVVADHSSHASHASHSSHASSSF